MRWKQAPSGQPVPPDTTKIIKLLKGRCTQTEGVYGNLTSPADSVISNAKTSIERAFGVMTPPTKSVQAMGLERKIDEPEAAVTDIQLSALYYSGLRR